MKDIAFFGFALFSFGYNFGFFTKKSCSSEPVTDFVDAAQAMPLQLGVNVVFVSKPIVIVSQGSWPSASRWRSKSMLVLAGRAVIIGHFKMVPSEPFDSTVGGLVVKLLAFVIPFIDGKDSPVGIKTKTESVEPVAAGPSMVK